MSARVEIGDAPAQDLARRAQPLERVDGFAERNAAAPMQEIEIEPIRAEPLEAALAGRDRAFSAGVVRIHLAHYKQAVAPAGHRSRHDFLRAAVAVHLGRVDERHPELEAERKRRGFGRRARLVLAHRPRAETERRHASSRPETPPCGIAAFAAPASPYGSPRHNRATIGATRMRG